MAGRKASPLELIDQKKVRHTQSQIEKRRNGQPQVKTNNLKCPSYLGKEEKKIWRGIIKLYNEIDKKIFNNLDIGNLEIYCISMALYRKAMDKCKGKEVTESSRGLAPNPWYLVATKETEKIRKYGQLLFLDPISRARMGIAVAKAAEEKTVDDPMGDLLNKRKRA